MIDNAPDDLSRGREEPVAPDSAPTTPTRRRSRRGGKNSKTPAPASDFSTPALPAEGPGFLPVAGAPGVLPAVRPDPQTTVPALSAPVSEAQPAADSGDADSQAARKPSRRRPHRGGRGRRRNPASPEETQSTPEDAPNEARNPSSNAGADTEFQANGREASEQPLKTASQASRVSQSTLTSADAPDGPGAEAPPPPAPPKSRSSRSRSRRNRGKTEAADASGAAAGTASGVTSAAEHSIDPDEAVTAIDEDTTQRPAPRSRQKPRGKQALPVSEDSDEPSTPVKNSDRKMLISVIPGDLVEVVLTEKSKVIEYYVEMVHHAKIRGNIYKGVVNNIDANLQAAFVNYGNVKNGFLQIDEVHPEYWLTHHDATKGHKYPPIQKAMKPGQEVLVQVVKEPTGNKGAFLTTWVSLAGRFLVLMPGQEQIGISRKVEDGEERNRLRELIKGIDPGPGLGAIVRTVSVGTSKTTLQKDLSFLKRVWKDIRKRATTEKAPSQIYQEPGLASRAVRDYLSEDVNEIWVDDLETAEAIREMTSLLYPRKADFVHLHQETRSLWDRFNIRKQLDQVHSREVMLPSGGRLVFDQTEALMAVDINSGKIGGKTNFEAMAHRTNMEAAESIALQLRLRDIGGQIVIDFIEMHDPEHGREVEKTLRAAMKADRARHDIGRMSSFGLLQIVRQRTGTSAISISSEPCPHCQGTGVRRNLEWQALQMLREMERQLRAAATEGKTEHMLVMETEIALYLLNNKRERLASLEKALGVRVDIRIAGLEH